MLPYLTKSPITRVEGYQSVKTVCPQIVDGLLTFRPHSLSPYLKLIGRNGGLTQIRQPFHVI